MNSVSLVGRLTKDPAVSTTKAGKSYVRFSLAVDRHIGKDKAQEGTPTADFISCVAWEKTADIIAQYAKKGSLAEVVGRIQTGSYEKDGQRVYTTDVLVNSFFLLGSKSENESSGGAPSASIGSGAGGAVNTATPPSAPSEPSSFIPDDDIPF